MIRSRAGETTERAHRVQAQEWQWGCWMRIIVLSAVSLAAVGCISMPTGRRESAVPDPLARAFMAEQRIEPLSFRLASSIRLRSPVYHPQGMTKVAGHFYVSAVEVIERPQRLPRPDAERVKGRGRGHLFKFDKRGNLVGQTILGEGSIYHPGGIDYDGKHLLVREPVELKDTEVELAHQLVAKLSRESFAQRCVCTRRGFAQLVAWQHHRGSVLA